MPDTLDPSSIAQVPGAEPAQVAATPPASQESDSAASLNQQAAPSQAAPDFNYKQGMYKAQEEAAALKKRLRDVEPFVDEFARNPQFRDATYEFARNYGQNAESPIDPAVIRVLDPALAEVRQGVDKIAAWEYRQQMEALAKDYPEIMTDDAKAELSAAAIGTGNYDLEYQFIKRYGKELISRSRKSATQDAVKTIQTNNQLYAHSAPSTALAPPMADLSKASEEEKQKFINSEADRIWSDPDYASKVGRNLG